MATGLAFSCSATSWPVGVPRAHHAHHASWQRDPFSPLQPVPAACSSRFQGRRPRGARRLRDDGGDGSSRAISQRGRRSEFVRTQPSWYSQGAARSAVLLGHEHPDGDADHLAKTWFDGLWGATTEITAARFARSRPRSSGADTGRTVSGRVAPNRPGHLRVNEGRRGAPVCSWSFVFARSHTLGVVRVGV